MMTVTKENSRELKTKLVVKCLCDLSINFGGSHVPKEAEDDHRSNRNLINIDAMPSHRTDVDETSFRYYVLWY